MSFKMPTYFLKLLSSLLQACSVYPYIWATDTTRTVTLTWSMIFCLIVKMWWPYISSRPPQITTITIELILYCLHIFVWMLWIGQELKYQKCLVWPHESDMYLLKFLVRLIFGIICNDYFLWLKLEGFHQKTITSDKLQFCLYN